MLSKVSELKNEFKLIEYPINMFSLCFTVM
jgi:hypothetical protein